MFIIEQLLICSTFFSTISAINPFRAMFPQIKTNKIHSHEEVGDPLFLTPLLEDGKIKEAQEASLVKLPEAPLIPSYAGFITVNKIFNSNMFFWYFPAAYDFQTAPTVLWLQGGPGGSSLFGLFAENGPFSVTENLELERRNTAWSLTHNVIYIDNPVGTGFSFTYGGYAENQTAVGEDLFACLVQIFTLFPYLQENDFYVTGESYAGKYIPAISYKIHQANKDIEEKDRKIKFKGMAIGDGLCDPVSMTNYGDFLLGIGLVDTEQRDQFQEMSAMAVDFINQEEWIKAFEVFDNLLNGDTTGYPSFFANTTGFNYYFNYLNTEEPEDMGYYPAYLEKASTRLAIHVGNLTYNSGEEVEKHLLADIMQSTKPWIQEIMNAGYKVLIYNGQLDVIIAHTLTQSFIDSMTWADREAFDAAPRKKWYVGPELAGYSKSSENFTQLLVRNAGHMVPYDQPKWSFDMINRFTSRKSFFKH